LHEKVYLLKIMFETQIYAETLTSLTSVNQKAKSVWPIKLLNAIYHTIIYPNCTSPKFWINTNIDNDRSLRKTLDN
jgi:hypothetical protein